MRKRIWFLCVLVLLIHCAPPASALDTAQTGSIRLTLPGGDMLLYRVGEIGEADGQLCFLPTGDFSTWDGSLVDIQSPELANELAAYVQANKFSGISGRIQDDGKVTFSGLMPGLYLLVQTEAASGYELIAPFLVSLPVYEADGYHYDVDASPKFQLSAIPTQPQPSLPQTGQLNWPVPVLGISGLILFLLGLLLQRSRHG